MRKHRLNRYLTCRRIAIARLGYRGQVSFPALADGRFSQKTILLIKPHLISHTAPVLIQEAMGKSKLEVEKSCVAKFPQPDMPTLIQPWTQPQPLAMNGLAPCTLVNAATTKALSNNLVAPVHVVPSTTPVHASLMVPLAPRSKVAPLSPDRNALRVTIDDETVELLEQARDLSSHAMPNADVGAVLERATGTPAGSRVLAAIAADRLSARMGSYTTPRAGRCVDYRERAAVVPVT